MKKIPYAVPFVSGLARIMGPPYRMLKRARQRYCDGIEGGVDALDNRAELPVVSGGIRTNIETALLAGG